MESLPVVVLAWVIAAAWCCIIAIVLLASRNHKKTLHPLPSGAVPDDLPRLSIIVPARNEEGCIEACICSLLRQDYPHLEVIAVNDRSSDRTAAILNRLEAEYPDRFRALHVETLPEGWFGKPHALNFAMSSATGNLLLFTDSDCEFLAPTALRTAVAEFQRRKLDFYTIGARYTMPTLRDCVTVPACSEIVLQWLRPERVEDPNWPDTFANGAFIMVNRVPFERLGGWRCVGTKVSEDFELAREFKRNGYRTGLNQAIGFYQTRSYETGRECWNGWSRIFAGALTTRQLTTTVLRMLVMTMLPLFGVLWGTVQAIATRDPGVFLHGAVPGFLCAYAIRTGIDFFVYWQLGSPVSTAILAPVGRLFGMAVSIRAILSRSGLAKTHWRGATFSANRMIVTPQPSAIMDVQTREIRAESVVSQRVTAS